MRQLNGDFPLANPSPLGLSLHRKHMAFPGRHQEQRSVVKRHYKRIFVLFKISQAKVLGEVYAGVEFLVVDAAVGGDVFVPLGRVIADEIVDDMG